jgi:hypothetical protein
LNRSQPSVGGVKRVFLPTGKIDGVAGVVEDGVVEDGVGEDGVGEDSVESAEGLGIKHPSSLPSGKCRW